MTDEGEEGGKILYEQLSYTIVEAALRVRKKLPHGLYERLYRKAMIIEFRKRGIPWAEHPRYTVTYDDEEIGEYEPDLIADSKVLLELKTTKAITDAHVGQTLNYLAITGLRLGIILNFAESGLQFKRVIR
jgi:GxxExxY protein